MSLGSTHHLLGVVAWRNQQSLRRHLPWGIFHYFRYLQRLYQQHYARDRWLLNEIFEEECPTNFAIIERGGSTITPAAPCGLDCLETLEPTGCHLPLRRIGTTIQGNRSNYTPRG
eukprot:scaffold40313_cov168-Skeletonema_marinoi.AAC.1